MATDKRAAERKLEELLKAVSWHRSVQAAHRFEGSTDGVARYKGILKLDYALIRSHCAEHKLELPHDVPPEAHPSASDTE